MRLTGSSRPKRKRLSPSSRRTSGGLSSSFGSTVSASALPGRRPPRHPSTNRLSMSLTNSTGSSSSPPPSPSFLVEDTFPSVPVALPDRAALDELRKSLRTPAFRDTSDPPSADGGAPRKKSNDWSTFDVGLHVALIDYAFDRLVDCRNTLVTVRDMSLVRFLGSLLSVHSLLGWWEFAASQRLVSNRICVAEPSWAAGR